MENGLVRTTTATPSNQANIYLHKLVNLGHVIKVGRGVFALPQVAREDEQAEVLESEAADQRERLTVAAYGLFWNRNDVDWDASHGKLLGTAGGTVVDFADQTAVYLLHSGNEIAYVGQSQAQGLFLRLRSHNGDRRKTDRWDAFSWFGFRPVKEDGTLLAPPDSADISDVINVIEAILIEGLMPRLNMRRGEGANEWLEASQYFQVSDPVAIAKRLSAWTQVGRGMS